MHLWLVVAPLPLYGIARHHAGALRVTPVTTYDPEITFIANARKALEASDKTFLESGLAEMLRDAYDDGWHDARAYQHSGNDIPECSTKWD